MITGRLHLLNWQWAVTLTTRPGEFLNAWDSSLLDSLPMNPDRPDLQQPFFLYALACHKNLPMSVPEPKGVVHTDPVLDLDLPAPGPGSTIGIRRPRTRRGIKATGSRIALT